jgi:S-adenosyl-L-methionine hydrolase (adenosine-forming)
MPSPIVTLLSDFGLEDYYVAAMKAVILRRNPAATIVDIAHTIAAQNIVSAAYVLFGAYRNFPPGSVHLAVVDPGVGSERKPIVVRADEQYFVGPDNGLFSLIIEQAPQHTIFEITNRELYAPIVSPTFHGRDVFAETAGALSTGLPVESIGPQLPAARQFAAPIMSRLSESEFETFIIHIDHFGNCVTGIRQEALADRQLDSPFTLEIRGRKIERLKKYYAESPLGIGAPFAIWGSAGFLEISVAEYPAAALLRAAFGDRVRLRLGSSDKRSQR